MTTLEQIDAVEQAAGKLADAMAREAAKRAEKAEHEAAVVASLIGSPNPMTNKPHSASSATEAAGQDEGTVALRREIADAECAVVRARGEYEATKYRAQFAVALVSVAPDFSGVEG